MIETLKQLYQTMIAAIVRHIMSVLLGFITAKGLMGFFPEGFFADLEMLITSTAVLAGYAIFEKTLKPLWQRYLGETA
jgi:hypothetical protein